MVGFTATVRTGVDQSLDRPPSQKDQQCSQYIHGMQPEQSEIRLDSLDLSRNSNGPRFKL